jgi:hypothetical protein
MPSQPISLSDESLTSICQMVAPLEPPDRSAFLVALAMLLRQEPQPPGDGVTMRHARSLLKTGLYHRSSEFIRDESRPEAYTRDHKPYTRQQRA